MQGFAKLVSILAEVYPDEASRPKIIGAHFQYLSAFNIYRHFDFVCFEFLSCSKRLGPDADYQDHKPAQALIYKRWAEDFLGNISEKKVPLFAATL